MYTLSNDFMNKTPMERNLKLLGIVVTSQFISFIFYSSCFSEDDLLSAKVCTDI